MSKLLTVFGATGAQGGSVVKEVLANPKLFREFKVRAVTRNRSSAAAQELSKRGVEVVQGDLSDKASLSNAIVGSHSVFGLTNFWDPKAGAAEEAQGKSLADVCKEQSVQHLIWSSLPSPTEVSNGKYTNILYFETKAAVAKYIQSIGLPYTTFEPGYFMSNLAQNIQQANPGEPYLLKSPIPVDAPLNLIDSTEDSGKYVAAILLNRESLLGQRVIATSCWYSAVEVMDTFNMVFGPEKTGKSIVVSDEEWSQQLPEQIRLGMVENMWLIRDFKYYGPDAEEQVEKGWKLLEKEGYKTTTLAECLKREKYWG